MNKFLVIVIFFLVARASFYSQCPSGQSLLEINIVPDFFSDEITWQILQNNTQILSGTSNSDQICIDTSQCLIVVVNDAGNDGICCAYGNGFFEVFLDTKKIGNGSSFGSIDSTYFNCPVSNPITEDDGVTIPTAFSPNGVGHEKNNTFSIIVNEKVSFIDFFIYDRWGELIFVSENLYFSWDGTFKGNNCMSGIYAYQALIIYEDGSKKIKTGNITLIR
jgi:gliding motility-associated-like protein